MDGIAAKQGRQDDPWHDEDVLGGVIEPHDTDVVAEAGAPLSRAARDRKPDGLRRLIDCHARLTLLVQLWPTPRLCKFRSDSKRSDKRNDPKSTSPFAAPLLKVESSTAGV